MQSTEVKKVWETTTLVEISKRVILGLQNNNSDAGGQNLGNPVKS